MLGTGIGVAQEYSFQTFDISEGLNNLAIRQIYQDRVGFIWINTENGVYRYDGERFEPFGAVQGIPPATDVAFGEAPDDSLLVGDELGLYQLSGNSFRKVPGSFKTVNPGQGIASDGNGHTWLATDAGLVELSLDLGQTEFAQRVLPRPSGMEGMGAYGVLLDGQTLWYGCGEEICRVDSQGTTVLGRASGLDAQQWLTILKDHDGNMWARGSKVGLLKRQAGELRFKKPELPPMASSLSTSPALDSDGRLLLPSPNGLIILTKAGWQRVDRSAGLRGSVYVAFEDRQDSLWVGLDGRGLVRWRGYRQWEYYSADNGLGSDIVFEILPLADGTVWAGTKAGVYRGVRGQFGYEWKRFDPLGLVETHSLQFDQDGNLWVGTQSHGVARVHLASGAVHWFDQREGLPTTAAFTLRFDRERRLWVAAEAGLFMAQPPYRQFTRVNEIPPGRMWALNEGKDGVLWAGGAGGLSQLKGNLWRTWGHADGLSNQEVLSLGMGPDGVLWVGYSYGGGIDRVHPTATGVTIERGVQRKGTMGIVYFLSFDTSGRLWAGTDHGVDMWNGQYWSHFDVSDGLAWDDCDLNAFAQEPGTDTVWIGTSGGLSRFSPRPHGVSNAPVQVVFTRLSMGQEDISALHDPSFGVGNNSLTARFSALNAAGHNEVVFRYRLAGESDSWTETTQRELEFVGLAPGRYRLEVEAGDSAAAWSRRPAVYGFTILRPWYRTWWFIALCVVIPVLGVALSLRLRVVNARARERQLLRLVEERTADLKRANEELTRISTTDSLTGLANRRFFDQTLEKECARILRSGALLSLVLFDVDHFKALNDSLGHQRGDACLVLLAKEMSYIARRSVDLAARFGGEEFAMILPNTGTEGALQIAEAVRKSFAALYLHHPASPIADYLTVSAGVASAAPYGWDTPELLIAAADRALYTAKHLGRNRVVVAGRE
jgi:diguanylate cyclase (GGDEF)-like protein